MQKAQTAADPVRGLRRALDRLGPVGRLLRDVVDLFAEGKGTRRHRFDKDRRQVLDSLRQLEQAGWKIDERGNIEPPPIPPPIAQRQRPGRKRNRTHPREESDDWGPEITIDTRTRQRNDPHDERWGQLTQWTLTPDSSNVYAFAYDELHSILYVTYKAQDGSQKANRPGPMYSYGSAARPFPRRFYEGLVRARSKGTWIWDNVRIRGTVYGHTFPYTLVGPGMGAVPRKATRRGLRTRTVPVVETVGQGKLRKSKTRLRQSHLPERMFRRIRRQTFRERGEYS